MNKNLYTPKTPYLLSIVTVLFFIAIAQGMYLFNTKSMSIDMQSKKESLVAFIGLPDLAISTEATFVRHRSMSDMFSIYKDDGSLREYFPSTYVYSHSHTINGYADAK